MLKSITLTFTEHAPVTLPTEGTTVFVGSNGSGKSLILRELELVSQREIGTLPTNFRLLGGLDASWPHPDQVDAWMSTLRPKTTEYSGHLDVMRYNPAGDNKKERIYAHNMNNISQMIVNKADNIWQDAASTFLRWGLVRLDGRGRFQLATDRSGGDLLGPPQNPLQALFQNDDVRRELQRLVLDAFGRHLTIDPTNLGLLGLKLSEQPIADERSLGQAAIDYYQKAVSVTAESDGVQAFIGILVAVLSSEVHTLLIDEPEAFLHPPLAHKLGKNLARLARDRGSSLLAATHSADFLMGCVQESTRVRVVRLAYNNGKSSGKLVDTAELKRFLSHPLMRSTNVASALFHDGVVVCESDNDRVLYGEIYHRLTEAEDGLPAILFLNAHNKQTVPDIVAPLRKFGVPAIGIVDIDVLKEGGNVWTKQMEAIGVPPSERLGLEHERKAIKDLLQTAGDMKRDGGIELLDASDLRIAERFFDRLDGDGLFVVRRGELESWLPGLGVQRSKSTWTVAVLEKMGSDPTAPDYVKAGSGDVWDFMRKIIAWINDERRKGMK